MRIATEGKIRVWLVMVEIQMGIPFFNHSYVVTRNSEGKFDSFEGTNFDGKIHLPERAMGGREASPLPDESAFRDLWQSGDIEAILESEVDADRLGPLREKVEKLRILDSKDRQDYSGVPLKEDQINCHSVSAFCLRELGLTWPGQEIWRGEAPGANAKVKEPTSQVSTTNPRNTSSAETPSNNGLVK